LALKEIGIKEKKKVQFVIVFYLLREGHAMAYYQSLKELFYFSKSTTCMRNIGLIT
jgi:hypothetical protein